ncbi:hypothetical protein GLW07_13010 [Bacillus hwajinpoensis]|uniref:Lipoprotein n=1 Tax=Guptibacillus hwajinpoensis TaxID=208199 RepID=A0A845F0E8_9BACL|nr:MULTISPECIES: DUF6376 family protein [Bacillaceae]MYL64271.1 hypothetical protein [Pseudalkalibacillus hwajinpoensis]PFG13473.1 hypothetical protein ATG70_1677 [Bacillus sp. es.036]
MKKIAIVFVTTILFLGGCSFLEDVNSTLNYVDEAREYASEASDFANEAPTLAKQAINDEQALNEFESRLEEMKKDIQEFNELEAPKVGAELHQNIVDRNEKAMNTIDQFLKNIEDGNLDPSMVENTDAFQTLTEINDVIDQINQLNE